MPWIAYWNNSFSDVTSEVCNLFLDYIILIYKFEIINERKTDGAFGAVKGQQQKFWKNSP